MFTYALDEYGDFEGLKNTNKPITNRLYQKQHRSLIVQVTSLIQKHFIQTEMQIEIVM